MSCAGRSGYENVLLPRIRENQGSEGDHRRPYPNEEGKKTQRKDVDGVLRATKNPGW